MIKPYLILFLFKMRIEIVKTILTISEIFKNLMIQTMMYRWWIFFKE